MPNRERTLIGVSNQKKADVKLPHLNALHPPQPPVYHPQRSQQTNDKPLHFPTVQAPSLAIPTHKDPDTPKEKSAPQRHPVKNPSLKFACPTDLGKFQPALGARREELQKKAETLLSLLQTRYTAMGGHARIFRDLDKNKNNILSKEEVKQAVNMLSVDVNDEEVKLLMDLMGQKNNQVSFESFCLSMFDEAKENSNHNPFAHRPRPRLSLHSHMPAINKLSLRRKLDSTNASMDSVSQVDFLRKFRYLDHTNSGIIPVHKFRASLKQLYPHLAESTVDGIMKSADVNNTGSVDYEELMRSLTVERSRDGVSNILDIMRVPQKRIQEDWQRRRSEESFSHHPKTNSNACVPEEGTPGYALDYERFHRSNNQHEDKSTSLPALLTHPYQTKLDKMHYQIKQMDAFQDEDLERQNQVAENRLKFIRDRREKYNEAVWYKRYGIKEEKQGTVPAYSNVFPLNELIYG
mmetsp:Transcript_12122/g.16515  ORF Transcript_12122/g.16515 Transcript_12122/m.16515 type:complete len:464 (-) Transcript_12122:395-1786(-)